MTGKTLIVSLHIAGGCFQYSNELFSRLTIPADIYVSNDLGEPLKIHGTKSLTFWKKPKLMRLFSLSMFLLKIVFLGLIGKYDKLVLAGYTNWDYYIMKAWRLTGKPAYFIVHDGVMHSGEKHNKTQRQMVATMKASTNLIFLSDYVRNNVKQTYGIDRPSIIVPHGLIDYGEFAKPHQFAMTKPTLLFVGRVTYYKGIDILQEAIGMVDPLIFDKLVIAGEWQSKTDTKSTDKIQIINRWLSNDEIRDIIAEADIMVFPYREASQSGVATLAVRYAVPSIVSNVGALAEQFPEDSAIIINDINPTNLSEAITRVCSDFNLRQRMHRNLVAGKSRYDWDNIAIIILNELSNQKIAE